ncbi:C4-dicarboxylate ABC transporter permease [Aquabacterium olei]|uniref:TRAP transporter small permease protein n=1 Tax=Aquabacterium olei TaxID=1296669 RepID=A0A2U8FS04_9BURK|nr:TRAP transporter small permease [Aquabacterium olei]AWI53845.1 C4-dicarboxylate ABC transporter permease [Aquabacterium olei]
MQIWLDRYCKFLDLLLALLMAGMVILVFGNVVLRYGFNSGITMSEEVSRWLFIWMTFLGAIVLLKDRKHLGTDMLVSRLPASGKRACLVASQLLMLYVCWLLFKGSLDQAQINLDVASPTTGTSMAVFYGCGVVFGASAALFLLRDLLLAITGRLSEDELVQTQESEDMSAVEAQQAAHKHAPAK